MAILWADRDPDWRAKEELALQRRRQQKAEIESGLPMSRPNFFALRDPTKIPADASDADISDRVRRFRQICRPFRPKRHVI